MVAICKPASIDAPGTHTWLASIAATSNHSWLASIAASAYSFHTMRLGNMPADARTLRSPTSLPEHFCKELFENVFETILGEFECNLDVFQGRLQRKTDKDLQPENFENVFLCFNEMLVFLLFWPSSRLNY